MNADWWNYVVRTAGTHEQKVIADESGIGSTVISRWFKGHNTPSAKLVVAFAHAYNRPPVEALVAAGYLTEADAGEVIEVHRGPAELSDEELLAEVGRRMKGHTNGLADETQPDASTETVENEEELVDESEAAGLVDAAGAAAAALDVKIKDGDEGGQKPRGPVRRPGA